MNRVIAIANQKGGVGKTTTTINLAAAIADKGHKVLILDLDPQGNTTSGLGIEKQALEKTAYQVLIGECAITETILKNVHENVDLIPSNVDLAAAEVELVDLDNQQFILKQEMDKIRDGYEFVLIDCPPSLSMLTVNAMTAATTVLVPIQCEYYALEGLSQLMQTIDLVRENLNPELRIEGMVFTMYDARTNLSMQVVENVRGNITEHVYNTIIPRNIRLAEAPSHGLPINQYEPKSSGAEAYRMLADEIINREF